MRQAKSSFLAYWNPLKTMESSQFPLARVTAFLTFACAVSVLFSIAASQTLLALSLAALLLSGEKLRLPPIRLPLALFIAGTILSLAFSGDAAAGRPQIRKLFVFFMLLVVFSALRELAGVRRLVLAWAGVGALASGVALVQFWWKLQEARQHGQAFYEHYVSERITGFMSHWMTFSGLQMIVLLMLAAFLLFAPHRRRRVVVFGVVAAALLGATLVLGMTRSIWLATAAAVLYLLWFWRRRWLLAAPVVFAVLLWLGPGSIRTRVASIYQPQREIDSNQHRIVCWRTGWEMIKAHPLLGLGPEMVRLKFTEYVPPDIPRPLPTGWYGHLHNVYIHYAAERGIPVMLILVWMLGKILWDFLSALRRLRPGPNDERFILHGAVAVIIGTLISGIFELNLGDSEVLMAFLAVVACGYLAVEKSREEVAHA